MSDRIRTSARDEEIIRRVLLGLDPDGVADTPEKWRVMRLALAVSMRLPVQSDDDLAGLGQRDRSHGSEYRLQQVTGEGKSGESASLEDLTDLLRAMLGVLHDCDLFHPDTRDSQFARLLEFHLERGLSELDRQWNEEDDLAGVLTRLLAPPKPGLIQVAADISAERLPSAFWELGIVVELRGLAVNGPRLTHVSLHVPNANDLDRIAAGLNRLAFVLGLRPGSLAVSPSDQPKTLVLSFPRPRETWEVPGYEALQRALKNVDADWALPLALGVDQWGHPVCRDLAKAPHLLLGGATGSGKSVALHALLCGLILVRRPQDLQLVLCDAKGTELTPYGDAPHTLGKIASTATAIAARIDTLASEMDERYVAMKKRGVRDVSEARRKGLNLPYQVLVIDELADLLLQTPSAEDGLVRVAQKGRAAGLHLILATQRPDSRTFSGLLRSNVPARVALAVQRTSESQIILGESGAQALLPPGDMLLRWSAGDAVRAHGYDMRPDDVAHAMRFARRGV